MPNYKMVFSMLAKGGVSQQGIAAICGCSKRDVSSAVKYVRETGTPASKLAEMTDSELREKVFPRKERPRDAGHLQPDVESCVARKLRHPKLTVKQFWFEHCADADAVGLRPYSYQKFCEMFAEEAKREDVADRLKHEPGAKVFIDYAGMAGQITDRLTGALTKVWVLVFCLPASCKIYAKGFLDVTERSWLDGHMNALEFFGGVPRMLIPDNCATATDRTSVYVTLVNRTYDDFASHYGCAVVPTRVRAPRDKNLAESTVDLIEKWAIAPSSEMTFYTLEEFNEYLWGRVDWLNSRPFSEREGSRDSDFDERERRTLMPLPAERFEVCEWRRAKVAPNYHVRIDYQYYSVDHTLIGKTVDVRLGEGRVGIILDGEVVAEHRRLFGRKGQYSTRVEHMPEAHRALPDPWSPDRFTSWADRIGPSTGEAIRRVLAHHVIVEQGFVPCRNILGLSKRYGAQPLERACGRFVATPGAVPSYTGLRNAILAEKAAEKCRR
ncbi:IS21 family transposase [Curtanaerobium respiraculi]|uniref:IS21 family transposase n=1 Tax=Curtanaerobium respiraculi TaxID=2949669 RepID=UPI0024B35EBB|nr:IS21 family transposase [Curtanaerobium respiraculi]